MSVYCNLTASGTNSTYQKTLRAHSGKQAVCTALRCERTVYGEERHFLSKTMSNLSHGSLIMRVEYLAGCVSIIQLPMRQCLVGYVCGIYAKEETWCLQRRRERDTSDIGCQERWRPDVIYQGSGFRPESGQVCYGNQNQPG